MNGKDESVVVYDGTSYFVRESDYPIDYESRFEEEVVFSGTFKECTEKSNELNESMNYWKHKY